MWTIVIALGVLMLLLWSLHDPHHHDMDFRAREIDAVRTARERRRDLQDRARRREVRRREARRRTDRRLLDPALRPAVGF